MGLHGERVVEVCVQRADGHLGVGQACAGRLEADFLSAQLADAVLATLAFDAVGDVGTTCGVLGRAPGEEQFSRGELHGGCDEVSWGRREA